MVHERRHCLLVLISQLGEFFPLSLPQNRKYEIASVSAIIERIIEGEVAVYVQTRWKSTGGYSETYEIPGGKIEAGEDVYVALRREVKEETGLEITKIKPEATTMVNGDAGQIGVAFVPFCGNLFYGSFVVGFVFVCEANGDINYQNVNEAKNPRWIKLGELKRMIEKEPESFFPYYLGALKYYVDQKEKGLI